MRSPCATDAVRFAVVRSPGAPRSERGAPLDADQDFAVMPAGAETAAQIANAPTNTPTASWFHSAA